VITEQQQAEAVSITSSCRDLTARFADIPALPLDAGAPENPAVSALMELDARALDAFVADCLAQLRQVMDELQ
jgi:hypothetical protein